MKIISGLILVVIFLSSLQAQNSGELRGIVVEKNENGNLSPVIGAHISIPGTNTGTSTDTSGRFTLRITGQIASVAVSSVGYRTDTLAITDKKEIQIVLEPEPKQVGEVEITGKQAATIFNYSSAGFEQTLNQKELFKAACCNLSESFETNPSVDVSFTDAITGLKQIEMLGLAGIYSQITVENMPAIRGLSSSVGLTYLPGTWMESIQVSKGVGSVANGYESITGQINVELRKPENTNEKKIFINIFGNQDRRFEGNLNYRQDLGSGLSSMTLIHGGIQRARIDENKDRFLDMPLTRTFNISQRFHFGITGRSENQLGVQFVTDTKDGGTMDGYGHGQEFFSSNPKEYGFGLKSRQFRLFGKNGYIFSGSNYSSTALQWSISRYSQSAKFNFREYNANETTGYLNLLFQSSLYSIYHKYRLGFSFLYDSFDETFTGSRFRRTERVPGVFLEYTYNPSDAFTLIAGIRGDHHNMFGTIITPRIHARYTPQEDWVLRFVAGRGVRTANVISENMAFLASARDLDMNGSQNGYPFRQEAAWNFGFNITHYFLFDWREGTITLDLYRTIFDRQVVADLDHDPQQVKFYNLDGRSYSNTVQVELNFQPVEKLDTRIAYRLVDSKQTIGNSLRERPFIARHRALINLSYTTERENPDGSQMLYDITLQWFGSKRLPDTRSNPEQFKARTYSPGFVIANSQITFSIRTRFDFYLGIENLFGFKQNSPILDASNPDSRYFDSSLIWGPIYGRMLYAGLRWRM